VSSSPTVTGKADWKTIAPVMLPSARVSLRRRTHSTLLNFSGSSVATGATSSAKTRCDTPKLSASVLTPDTNILAPPTISRSERPVWTNIGQSGDAPDHGPSDGRARRNQPQR
jgi:hypothetical protein